MHKLGAVFDPEQEEFANQVEKYTTGLFRREFSTAAELLVEVTRVLREIEAAPSTAAALRDLCSIPAGQGCVPAEVITSRCAMLRGWALLCECNEVRLSYRAGGISGSGYQPVVGETPRIAVT